MWPDLLNTHGVSAMVRTVTETYYGKDGLWIFEAFEYLNHGLFAGELPHPLIVWGLTPHGCSLGRFCAARDRLPVLTLHPSLFGGTERSDPWGIPPRWLGCRFAFDVLIHELIHLSVEFRLGGWRVSGGETIHNNPLWVGEVNRLAPLLGFDNVHAGLKKVRRVPVDGPLTKRGKRPTKPARVESGNIMFGAVAGFPWQLRNHLGQAESYYGQPEPPFPASVPTPKIAPR